MKKTPVIHPFLFALFPVFFLYARNIGQFNPSVVLGPVITGLCWTLAGLVAGRLLLGDWKKAALAATMIVVPYLSFGQIEKVLPAATFST